MAEEVISSIDLTLISIYYKSCSDVIWQRFTDVQKNPSKLNQRNLILSFFQGGKIQMKVILLVATVAFQKSVLVDLPQVGQTGSTEIYMMYTFHSNLLCLS